MKKVLVYIFTISISLIILSPTVSILLNKYSFVSTATSLILATFFALLIYYRKEIFVKHYKKVLYVLIVLNVIYVAYALINYGYIEADAKAVFNIAANFQLENPVDVSYLFKSPNNIFIVFYEILIFFFAPNTIVTLKIFSLISLYYSYYITYLIAKKYYSVEVANFVMILLLSMFPMIIMAMYPYTDIYALPFFMLSIYLLSDVKETKKKIIGTASLSIAILLKSSPIVLFVAILIYIILFFSKFKIRYLVTFFFLLLIMLFGIRILSSNILGVTEQKSPCENGNIGIPATGFMLYSFNYEATGRRNNEDANNNYTNLCVDENIVIKDDLALIKERITGRSLKDKIDLTFSKIALYWHGFYGFESFEYSFLNIETYMGIILGNWNDDKTEEIKSKYNDHVEFQETLVYSLIDIFIISLMYAIYTIILLGFIFKIRKNRFKNIDYLLMLITIGYFLFYLMWEVDARYMTIVVPTICLLAGSSIDIFKKSNER